MAQTKHPKCYLCGEALSAPINRDHVPPRRFFAPELRKQFNLAELIKQLVAQLLEKANKYRDFAR